MQSSTDLPNEIPNEANDSKVDVPPGYSIQQMPDGHEYLVPNFLVDCTDLAIKTQAQVNSLKVREAPGGVSHITFL